MTSKIGRNALCHCGSGLKYKKCHLAEDAARGVTVATAGSSDVFADLPSSPPDAPLPLPVLPHRPAARQPEQDDDARDPLFERIQTADFEQLLPLADDLLGRGDLDRELAFELLDRLRTELVARGTRERFGAYVERLRSGSPTAYASDTLWYLSWLVEDAVLTGAQERLPELTEQLATAALQSIDEFLQVVDLLRFHHHVEPLITMLTAAWPAVRQSADLLEPVLDEYAMVLIMLLLARHLDRGGAPQLDDPMLRAELDPLHLWDTLDAGRMQLLLRALAGEGRAWQPSDFSHHGKSTEQLLENLMLLVTEWCGWLRRTRGVPFARADLARVTYLDYTVELPTGKHGHIMLLPRAQDLNRKLAALCSFLSAQYYKAGTLYALLPTFIEFLELRGLASPEQAARARKDYPSIGKDIARVVAEATQDEQFTETVRQAWSATG